ncbi:MAG: sugar diacid recognition domain-containing protein [Lachnospiraceae bacterium]|nr:sugar diacid recognition domain-containing protein [Lachnospiraceae bacterium]
MAFSIQPRLAQQIVDTLKTICSHDINFINTDGRISASTDPDRVNSYHSGGHKAARLGEIVTIEEDDPAQDLRHGINMPIRFHGMTVAVIGITGVPEEVLRYANLAQRLTLLLLREHEIDSKNFDNRTQMDYLTRALINGETVDPAFIKEILENNGVRYESDIWRTAVIHLLPEHRSPLAAIEAAMKEMMGRMDNCLFTFLFPTEFVIIMRDCDLGEWTRELLKTAARFKDDIKIGIGSPRKLRRQNLSCQAARLAAASFATGDNFVTYDAIRMELLLAGVSEDAKNAYLKKCLSGLDSDDRELLIIYFTNEMSLKRTADSCYLHVNTLQYRLNRIRERCGLDPRRFHDAADLYTALRLGRMP